MLANEPNDIVADLLATKWDPTEYGVAATEEPPITTGWYDFNAGGPMVTCTNTDMGVVNGDATGYTGGSGDGGVSKVWAGVVLLNFWAGHRDEIGAINADGTTPNPKALAYGMARHAESILTGYATGTTDDSGDVELASLGMDNPRMRVDTDEDVPAVYRYEANARFTYHEVTPA